MFIHIRFGTCMLTLSRLIEFSCFFSPCHCLSLLCLCSIILATTQCRAYKSQSVDMFWMVFKSVSFPQNWLHLILWRSTLPLVIRKSTKRCEQIVSLLQYFSIGFSTVVVWLFVSFKSCQSNNKNIYLSIVSNFPLAILKSQHELALFLLILEGGNRFDLFINSVDLIKIVDLMICWWMLWSVCVCMLFFFSSLKPFEMNQHWHVRIGFGLQQNSMQIY